MMHRLAFCFSIAALAVPFGAASNAMAQTTRAADIAQSFADHCFSPRLTAQSAQAQTVAAKCPLTGLNRKLRNKGSLPDWLKNS